MRHVWGASRAADRVWAQVSGLPAHRAAKRVFLVFQAAIDDSAEKDGVFVLAGYIATAESWAQLSTVWEKYSRGFGTPRDDGRYHFKMNEMAFRPDGIKKSEPFFRLIEDHVLGWVSARIDQLDLKRAIGRFHIPGVIIEDWESHTNPWYITFRSLIDLFHLHRAKMAEPLGEEKIDFYFDDGVDKKTVFALWDNYIKGRPEEIKKYYGAVPRFEDDMDFLPLQAADFWAWWVRKWHHEGTPEKIDSCDFGEFGPRRHKKYLRLSIVLSQDDIVKNLVPIVQRSVPEGRRIIDLKTNEVWLGKKPKDA